MVPAALEKLLRDTVRIVIVHVVVVEKVLIGFIHLLLLPLLIVVDHCVDNVFIQIGGHLLLEPIVEILFDEQLQEMKRAERRAVLQGQFAYDQRTVESSSSRETVERERRSLSCDRRS